MADDRYPPLPQSQLDQPMRLGRERAGTVAIILDDLVVAVGIDGSLAQEIVRRWNAKTPPPKSWSDYIGRFASSAT